jgi:TonB-dependent SusC/RagA subfamily outer membrane receptor
VGVLRPEIVVPEWLLARSEGEVRLAIDHEREHVRAGDPGLLFIGSVVTALLPWNPAAWWIFTRLRLAVELDCDRRVISAGAERFAYGTLLLDLAEHRPAHRLMAATGLIGATSHLERRIRVMTHTVRFAPLRAAVFGVPAVVALLAACETALPTAAEIEAMDAGAVEREAVALRLLPGTADGAAARFIVDGKEVSREEAMAILPEEIVTIAVRGSGPVRTRVSGGAEREARIEATESIALSAGPAAGVIAPDGSLPAGSVIEIVTRAGASAGIVPVEAGDGMVTLGVRTAEGGAGPDSTRIVVMRRSEPGVETEVFVNGLRVDDAGGVIRVTGSDDEELVVETVRMRSAAPVPADPTAGPARVEGSVMLLDGAGGKPLIFLDGERVAESSTSTVLGRLGPDAIESIEVIKGPAAATLYGDEAADGVIRIVTKANAAQQR